MGLLDGKAAIVTGSARGIGRATAELLAAEGAKVLINDLDGDVAEQTASEIDGETAVFGGDLTKEGAADELVAAAIDAFGEVDIVVNNAGYTWDGVAHKVTDEQFQAMLDIHTIVPFRVARALAPHWREAAKKEREEGVEVFRKLINTSSTTGMMGNAGQINYAAGKAGVVGITKTLAKEWGQFKINVNAVAFGFVETRLTAAKEEGGEIDRADRREDRARHPRADAGDGPGGHPARPRRDAGGGRGPGPLPRLAARQLRARPGAEHHRRHVRRDVHLSTDGRRGGGESDGGPAGSRSRSTSATPTSSGRSPTGWPAPTPSSTARPVGASARRCRAGAGGCCCSTTSAPRAAPCAPPPCSTCRTARTSSWSPPRAASRRTRPGSTTCAPTR